MNLGVLHVMKILVLDDNETAVWAIADALRRIDSRIIIETEASLDKARRDLMWTWTESSQRYDFLVMDLEFGDKPLGEGVEAIRHFRRANPEMKIIAVSGKIDEASQVLDAGAFAFFRKPKYEGLTETIQCWRELEGLGEELRIAADQGDVCGDILEQLGVGISVVDRRMRLLYVNPQQISMSGLTGTGPRVGHLCYEVFNPGATGICGDCPIVKLFRNPGTESEKSTHIRAGGAYHRVTALPLTRNGKIVAAIKMSYDVTNREEFNNFLKALDGDLEVERRILQVLNAVTSQGYKRVRMLLVRQDSAQVEGYRIRDEDGTLGNFGGKLESLGTIDSIREVVRAGRPRIISCQDSSFVPFWQEIGKDRDAVPIEHGLLPMMFQGNAIGMLYVDNSEPSNDPDLARIPAPLELHRLEQLTEIADEGAKAIEISKHIERARQGIELLQVDKALLREAEIPELLDTLVDSCLAILRNHQQKRILRKQALEISGEGYLSEGAWLVRITKDEYAPPDSPMSWHVNAHGETLLVKAFKSGNEKSYNDVRSEQDWQDGLRVFQQEGCASEVYLDFQRRIQSYACFPLSVQGVAIGAICLASPTAELFDGRTLDVLRARIDLTSEALERHRQMAEIKRLAEMYSSMALTKSLADENDMEKTIFAFLTGLTHKEGLAFNRAVYLERSGQYLVESRGIGPRDNREGEQLYAKFHQTRTPGLKETLAAGVRFNSAPYGISKIPISAVPSHVTSFSLNSSEMLYTNILELLKSKELYVLPLLDSDELIAAVLLDNFITGRQLSSEETEILQAVAVDYSTLFRNHRMILRTLEEQSKKDELLYVLSHRLKTDIAGPYELVKRAVDGDSEQLIRYLPSVAAKLKNLYIMLQDLLQFSLIQSGNLRAHANLIPHDIAPIVRAAVQTVLPTGHQGLEVKVLANAKAQCDENLVNHVIVNVLDNAIQYSPTDTSTEITIDLPDVLMAMVVVTVINRPYEPVQDEDLDSWFALFTRGKNGKFAKGTGLGLYIADQIISIHGGTISASALPDGRVAVAMTIPACEE